MVDSLEGEPINVGALPELDGGGGHVFFELGNGGYAPSEFFLTLESGDVSLGPTGEPVLSGPRAADSGERDTIRAIDRSSSPKNADL